MTPQTAYNAGKGIAYSPHIEFGGKCSPRGSTHISRIAVPLQFIAACFDTTGLVVDIAKDCDNNCNDDTLKQSQQLLLWLTAPYMLQMTASRMLMMTTCMYKDY